MKQLPGHGFRIALQRVLALIPLLLCTILCMPNQARAGCTLGTTAVLNFSLPATVTIPRDSPLGTVITSGVTTTPPYSQAAPWGVTCNAATTYSESNMYGSNAPTTSHIIPTAIPGVGYQLYISSLGKYYDVLAPTSLPLSSFSAGGSTGCAATPCYLILGGASLSIQLRLVVTGPITGTKTIPATDLYQLVIGGLLATDVRLANSTQIVGQTCVVNTPSITVPLGAIKSSVFTGVGTVSTAVPFTIGLNCSGITANVGVTFTDSNSVGNTTNILTIQSATSPANATGVGIKIAPGGSLPGAGTAVSYGPDASVAGNLHQIMLGSSGSLPTSLPFTAQYTATASNVTPGPANGVATFTMSYQ
jgi:type 1 fimbria pilin